MDELFSVLVERGGSDLHLLEGQPPKIRRHGEVTAIGDSPLDRETIVRLLEPICSPPAWRKFTETGDLDFAYEMDENNRFRCNFYKQLHGYGAVFRIIPTKIKTLKELGVPPVIESFGNYKSGLVLVTGPTGSGKSTTLAAVVDSINTHHSRHIVTIEEPIEFVHPNKKSVITQREVPNETPSFAAGLKAALREDADVVLVGEMRDLETIALALTAAETNARKTVDRIIDAFPSNQQEQIRTMLANSLRAVCAQLLLKRSDGGGRLAVNEILVGNNAVASIIREGATMKLNDVLKTGKAEGMQLMDDAIDGHLKAARISPMEAYMKAIDKLRFQELLPKDAGIG
ncbi:PilT/PilU family type 4a pilus ATPase [bacterium]|nr:PilT/PilU family type 4a pilus ATPase [bacterium]